MIIEGLVLGCIAGWIMKGSVRNLQSIALVYSEIFIIGFIIRVLAQASSILPAQSSYLFVLSYILLFTGILFNKHIREIQAIGLGLVFNFIIIVLNGFTMPVMVEMMDAIGREKLISAYERGVLLTHSPLDQGVPLWFLGDVIPINLPYISYVISIGDVIISLSVFVLISRYMTKSPSERF